MEICAKVGSSRISLSAAKPVAGFLRSSDVA